MSARTRERSNRFSSFGFQPASPSYRSLSCQRQELRKCHFTTGKSVPVSPVSLNTPVRKPGGERTVSLAWPIAERSRIRERTLRTSVGNWRSQAGPWPYCEANGGSADRNKSCISHVRRRYELRQGVTAEGWPGCAGALGARKDGETV